MRAADDFSFIRKELERIEKEKAARLQERPVETTEQKPTPYIFATDYVDCAFYDATLYDGVTVWLPEDFTI